MKKHWTLPALFFIIVGAYFLFNQFSYPLFQVIYSSNGILMLFGLAFLVHAMIEKDAASMLPATLLIGIGAHFLWKDTVSIWPDDITSFLFIISIGIFLQSKSTKSGLFPGIIIFLLALFLYFFPSNVPFSPNVQKTFPYIQKYWPMILIIIGVILFARRK